MTEGALRVWSREELRSAMLLYAVTDNAWLGERKLSSCVEQAIEGGATFVQLRDKQASTAELVTVAREIIPLCSAAGVPFVINDDLEAALASGADGVHVGQEDAACSEARRVLGPDAIVGVSVQTLQQALEAQDAGASYLGVGAMYSTSTKDDAKLVSASELASICAAVDIPVVAIGGLNEQSMGVLSDTGVDGAAVVSAIFAAEDIAEASRVLLGVVKDVTGA